MPTATVTASNPPVNTPWGKPDTVEQVANGIWWTDTPSHGGFYIDRETLKRMPKHLRNGRSQWFEEDCDWCLVFIAFGDEIKAFSDRNPPNQEQVESTFRNWHPEAYAAHHNIPIESLAGRSSTYDRQQAEIRHANDMIAVAAWGDWCKTVPKRMVGVVAAKGGRRAEGTPVIWALVTSEAYATRGPIGYVLKGDEPAWQCPN